MADASINDSAEIWKPIPGWDRYEASSLGRIRRLEGFVRGRGNGKRFVPARVLKPTVSCAAGYLNVMLCDGVQRTRTFLVHILICTAFHGPKPSPRHQVAHGDGNTANNVASNLRWATAKENAMDRIIHGTGARGETSGVAKLSEADVLDIRTAHKNKTTTLRELGRLYGVSDTQIGNIVRRRQWAHI